MSFGKLILEAGNELNEALRQCRVSVEAAQKLREPGEVKVFKRRSSTDTLFGVPGLPVPRSRVL